jgi:hypothetical protein
MDNASMVYIYKTEYYLAIKRNEIFMQSTMPWMSFGNTILSEKYNHKRPYIA